MSERVLIPVADGELPAYLWVPESGTGPGVVLFQEIFGLSPYIHRRAADLAALISIHQITDAPMPFGPLTVTAIRTLHPPLVDCFAYRFQTADKAVVFSGDTARLHALDRSGSPWASSMGSPPGGVQRRGERGPLDDALRSRDGLPMP